ncbi:MAG TPA: efflux RND transporter periplasmic adaptor subunit [Opitutaceae bacterium]|nr:efflux RND transporter periplasmic adaptor subunit [Opitutaceae bacterium]
MMNARRFPPGHLPAIRLASPGVAAALILACGGCAKAPAPAAPPPTVTVVTVEQRNVPVTQEWVASLYGYVDAQVRAQVSGYLLKQDYRDGATVRAGDPLFEIDPRPFQAALAQAEAQLAQARAQLGKAEDDVRRYGPLAKDQAISQQEMDDAVQAELGAKAQVAAGQAAVDRAQLDLGFTHLQSPISGVAGIVQAQVGDLVGPGTGALTTVSTLDPMKVYFPIGEQDYLELGRAQGGGFPPNAVLELILGDGSVYPEKGRFYAEDRQIDPSTGTLRIAATFPNPKSALRPGQYGRVRAVIRTLPGALLVPQQALNELQGGYQVATVDASNRAHVVTVTTGPRIGQDVVIASGLRAGDRVIVDGFAKAREGAPVNPQPVR